MSLLRRHRALVLLVAGAAVLRTLLAWRQAGPLLLPDEYLYTELSRSLGAGGLPLVRGELYPFPALLAPLLTAPVWLVHDVGTAYRIAQAEGALAFSLAAVPAFALARRVGVRRSGALAAAAVAVLVPDAVDAGLLLSEPYAYPLFLGSVWALVGSLAPGGRRNHVAFLALTALAIFARAQLLVLPLAYACTLLAVGGRRRTLVRTLRAQALPAGVLGLAALAAVAAGPARAAGVYGAIFDAGVAPGSLAHWAVVDAVVLCVAAGWVLVPGAAVGLGAAIARPLRREEEAFAWASAALLAGLVAESAFFGNYGSQLVERYAFYAAPLLVVAFALAAERGLLRTRAHVAACGALAAAAVASPLLAELYFSSPDHAPVLLAYAPVERLLDWRAPIVVGPLLAALALAALALGSRGRTRALAALALCLCAAVSLSASTELASHSRGVAGGRSFVDDAGVGDASFLGFRGTGRQVELSTLFWNRSINSVLRIGSGSAGFATRRVRLDRRGRLLDGGREVHGPLVVDTTGALVRFREGRVAARARSTELRTGRIRLALLVDGYYPDGRWLSGTGTVESWTHGSLSLRLRAFPGRPQRLELRSGHRRIALRVGTSPRTVSLALGRGAWSWRSTGDQGLIGGKIVAFRVDAVRWRPVA